MYYDFTVPIPQIQGKIIQKKKGQSVYILYQYGQEYNAEKQYSVPQRSSIGKQSKEDKSRMYPNENYQNYFPDASMPEELPEAYRSCALRIGSYAIIRKILQEYKLPQMLEEQFGKDCGLFLDLVSYLIVDEENAGQYYPDFAYCHPLFSDKMRIYSDVKVSRFLASVSKDQIIRFLDAWNQSRDHRQRIYISYDSTNKNSQAGDIDLIEYGKPKDNKGLPIFNLSIAYDKTNRVPLFYEEYPGSITDVSQFVCTVDKVREYGYRRIGFILDRGYFSKDNIRYMESHRYAFIIMVKGQKELVSSLIKANRNTFETDRECVIRSYRVYGMTVTDRLYEDDKKDRYFHLYFNPSKQAAEREQLEQKLDRLKLYMEKHKGQEISFGKTYHDYFDLHYDKNKIFISYNEKKDIIKNQLELCGYFSIITSEKMTAAQALIHYKGRDISEKLFGADKTFIGSRSERVHTGERMSAKLFIEFIALIVRNRVYNLLKETMLRLETKPNYMTVPASIREMEKIELVRRNNGRYCLDHAVSKRQKIILSCFGMDEEDIRSIAADISRLLVDDQSLMSTITLTEEEEYDNGETESDIIY